MAALARQQSSFVFLWLRGEPARETRCVFRSVVARANRKSVLCGVLSRVHRCRGRIKSAHGTAREPLRPLWVV